MMKHMLCVRNCHKKYSMKKFIYLVIVITAVLWKQTSLAQKVMLDAPLKAGPLTVFPDVSDENIFYYLTDKPHIATGANGKPQFSFLKFVDNNATTKEGDGGGLVHAVIILEVTDEQRRLAERELQRVKSGAIS